MKRTKLQLEQILKRVTAALDTPSGGESTNGLSTLGVGCHELDEGRRCMCREWRQGRWPRKLGDCRFFGPERPGRGMYGSAAATGVALAFTQGGDVRLPTMFTAIRRKSLYSEE